MSFNKLLITLLIIPFLIFLGRGRGRGNFNGGFGGKYKHNGLLT